MAGGSKEANKGISLFQPAFSDVRLTPLLAATAKSDSASVGTKASAAGDAAKDKASETKHDAKS